ncbi:PspA/IM30 family protein [Hugenholtzia roseola]|uniref:PspA/IM30 family protein n=1 Tax=Hugenholtzia roseola TaxID=1002 RepID=UPI0004789FED|nr:PspA/IM30 family protein [Hugenholtzia roseola]
MSIFKRLFNMGKAEAHSAIDKLEDPIKMTEQGIRDLKTDLDKSLQGLAEIKALAIRARREHQQALEQSKSYEQKAILLLQKAQAGQLEPAEADRLASEMLRKKEEAQATADRTGKEAEQHEQSVARMNQNIQTLKSKVSSYENELRTLKARAKVSESTKKINQQLAQVDSSGTVAMLERMKEKVAQQEALAESYGEIAQVNKTVEDEVDKVLGPGSGSTSASLLELKAKLGLAQNATPDASQDPTTPPPTV